MTTPSKDRGLFLKDARVQNWPQMLERRWILHVYTYRQLRGCHGSDGRDWVEEFSPRPQWSQFGRGDSWWLKHNCVLHEWNAPSLIPGVFPKFHKQSHLRRI
ncbi:hypothetical protein FJTKL_02479 [Diaporthe vaccinii]|uniref:Uncharacterized protein n=1 Tax=Diaporthe vaccinii TaxID=105482 RepID=A0ABR4DY94_9PEZI